MCVTYGLGSMAPPWLEGQISGELLADRYGPDGNMLCATPMHWQPTYLAAAAK